MCGVCDRCGKNSKDIAFVENLPIYRSVVGGDGRKTLEYVGLDTHLCPECVEEYRADNLRLNVSIKLSNMVNYDIA